MALVKVRWQVLETHEAEIEIDGYDPNDGIPDEVLAEHETDKSYRDTPERDVLEETVLRKGEKLKIDVTAPKHAPEWGDD